MSRRTESLTSSNRHRLTMAGLSLLSAAAIATDICLRLIDDGAQHSRAVAVATAVFVATAFVLHLCTRPER